MRAAAASIFIAALVATGAEAATPIWWTPAHMAKALTALQYPHPGTLGGRCVGATKARHGTYTGFRCRMVWQIEGSSGASTNSGTVTVWARPLPAGRVCGSTRSLAACRPLAKGPLAGDPTVCTVTRTTPAEQAHDCASAAAKTAIVAKHGDGVANLRCDEQQDLYHWSCESLSGPFLVVFTRGVSAWTVTVTP